MKYRDNDSSDVVVLVECPINGENVYVHVEAPQSVICYTSLSGLLNLLIEAELSK